ncbi:MAG: hypothetical protein M3500_01335 [Actinomycetota bacterium]|nr:hypothetical protein [Actinomycetota bacterium]
MALQLRDLAEVVAARDSPGERVDVVGFAVPFLAQRGDDLADRARLGVLGRRVLGRLAGVLWSEVGPVAAERRDPELARLLEVGDEMGGVGSAAAVIPTYAAAAPVCSPMRRCEVTAVAPCAPCAVVA